MDSSLALDARRIRRLRIMFGYTAVTAGAAGIAFLAAPRFAAALLGFPPEEPLVFGVVGSVFAAFALLSVAGLRDPVTFAPVLLLQLLYKAIWFLAVVGPRAATGALPGYAFPTMLLFSVYVVGDLVAVPFRELLGAGGARVAARVPHP